MSTLLEKLDKEELLDVVAKESPIDAAKILLKLGKDIPKNIIDNIARNSSSDIHALYSDDLLLNLLSKHFERVSDDTINIIANCPYFEVQFIYNLAVQLINHDRKIPDIVYKKISNSPYRSYGIAYGLVTNKREVPEILWSAISEVPPTTNVPLPASLKNLEGAYVFAENLRLRGIEIPYMLKRVLKDSLKISDRKNIKISNELKKELENYKTVNESVIINEKLDKDKLLEAVAKHLKQSMQSWDMHPEDVVKIFDKIGEELLIYGKIYPYEVKSLFIKMGKKPPDLVFPYFYESTIINEKLDKEELMSAFLKDPNITYKYVRKNFLDKNEEPPEKFINAIAQSAYASESYFRYILKQKINVSVSDVIKKGILKDSQSTLQTWEEFGEFMPMNDIVNSISQSPYKSIEFYKIQKEKNKKVPPIILKSIISNEYASYDLAKIFLEENKPVPDVIIRGFISRPESIFTFAMEVLKKGFDLPKIILRIIADNADNYMGLSGYADFDTILFSYLKQNKKIPDILLDAFDKKKDHDIARFCMQLGTHHIKIPDRILDLLIEKTPKHGVTRYLGVVSYDILSYYLIKSPESVANPEEVLKTIPSRLYQYAIGPDMVGIIHTKKLIKGFLTVFGKVPEDFKQAIINEYEKYGNTIPKEIADAVGIKQAKTINEKLEKDELLDAVIKDANSSYNLINQFVKNDKEVPEILYKGLVKDPSLAEWETRRLMDEREDIPDILIKSIATKTFTAREFSKHFWDTYGKEPPEIILNAISRSHEYSLYYARDMIKSNREIPEIITKGISKNYFSSALYADELKEAGREVPDIILKTYPEISARLQHQEYEKKKSKTIEEKLEKEELLDAVIKDKYQVNQLVFNFAANNKKIPEKLAEYISQNWNPSNLYQIATDIIRYSNYDVPEMILQGIAKSNSLSNETAYLYKNHYLEIPDVIMNALTPKQKEFYNSVWWSKQKPITEKLDKNELLKTVISDETTPDDSHIEFPIKLIKMGNTLPDDIINVITQSAEDAAMFVNRIIIHLRDQRKQYGETLNNTYSKTASDNLKNFLKNIPHNILKKIAENVDYSYEIGDDLLFQKIKIPDILLQKISKSKVYSHRLKNYYDLHYEKVPEIIANAVKANTKKPVNPDTITEKLDKSELLKTISKNAEGSSITFRYLWQNDKKENIPKELLKGMAKDPIAAYTYATSYVNFKDVPQIILKGIAKDSGTSLRYAKDLVNRRIKIPNLISKSIYSNTLFAKRFDYFLFDIKQDERYKDYFDNLFDRVINEKLDKNELLGVIQKDYEGFIQIMDFYFRTKKEYPPEEFLKMAVETDEASRIFAEYCLEMKKDIPDEVIKKVAENPRSAYTIAALMILEERKVPEILIKSIYSDPLSKEHFTRFAKNQDYSAYIPTLYYAKL